MKLKMECFDCHESYTFDTEAPISLLSCCTFCGSKAQWVQVQDGAGVELGREAKSFPDILDEMSGAGEADLTELVVAFAAQIYDVLSPGERLTFWRIISAYAKGKI